MNQLCFDCFIDLGLCEEGVTMLKNAKYVTMKDIDYAFIICKRKARTNSFLMLFSINHNNQEGIKNFKESCNNINYKNLGNKNHSNKNKEEKGQEK